MADLQAFIAQWNGHYADFPGGDGGQCVDLVEFWARANGFPRFFGNAVDQAGRSWPGATWTPNCEPCVPSAGDVVVWGTAGVGPFGHIAIFVSGNTGSFTSFDQNWPIGSPCHLQSHNYNAVLGWQALHLAPAPPPPVSAPPPPSPAPPPPSPVSPPPAVLLASGVDALGALLLAAAAAGALYWRQRRPGEPVTLANVERDLLEGLRSGLQTTEDLTIQTASGLEDALAELRDLLPVPA